MELKELFLWCSWEFSYLHPLNQDVTFKKNPSTFLVGDTTKANFHFFNSKILYLPLESRKISFATQYFHSRFGHPVMIAISLQMNRNARHSYDRDDWTVFHTWVQSNKVCWTAQYALYALLSQVHYTCTLCGSDKVITYKFL
jgi:hypothetical protein